MLGFLFSLELRQPLVFALEQRAAQKEIAFQKYAAEMQATGVTIGYHQEIPSSQHLISMVEKATPDYSLNRWGLPCAPKDGSPTFAFWSEQLQRIFVGELSRLEPKSLETEMLIAAIENAPQMELPDTYEFAHEGFRETIVAFSESDAAASLPNTAMSVGSWSHSLGRGINLGPMVDYEFEQTWVEVLDWEQVEASLQAGDKVIVPPLSMDGMNHITEQMRRHETEDTEFVLEPRDNCYELLRRPKAVFTNDATDIPF